MRALSIAILPSDGYTCPKRPRTHQERRKSDVLANVYMQWGKVTNPSLNKVAIPLGPQSGTGAAARKGGRGEGVAWHHYCENHTLLYTAYHSDIHFLRQHF